MMSLIMMIDGFDEVKMVWMVVKKLISTCSQAGQETHTGSQLLFTLDRFYGDPHPRPRRHNMLPISAPS